MNVGARIKAKRLELEWSQEQLAKKMGYKSKVAISKFENGNGNLKMTTITKFAKALNCSEAYLMGRETDISKVDAGLVAEITKNPSMMVFIKMFNSLSEEHQSDLLKQLEYLHYLENKKQ